MRSKCFSIIFGVALIFSSGSTVVEAQECQSVSLKAVQFNLSDVATLQLNLATRAARSFANKKRRLGFPKRTGIIHERLVATAVASNKALAASLASSAFVNCSSKPGCVLQDNTILRQQLIETSDHARAVINNFLDRLRYVKISRNIIRDFSKENVAYADLARLAAEQIPLNTIVCPG